MRWILGPRPARAHPSCDGSLSQWLCCCLTAEGRGPSMLVTPFILSPRWTERPGFLRVTDVRVTLDMPSGPGSGTHTCVSLRGPKLKSRRCGCGVCAGWPPRSQRSRRTQPSRASPPHSIPSPLRLPRWHRVIVRHSTHRSAVVVSENLLVEVVEQFLFQLQHHLPRTGRQVGAERGSGPVPPSQLGTAVVAAVGHPPRGTDRLSPSGRCLTPGKSASRPRWCRRPGPSASWPSCRESGKDTET